MTDRPAVAFVRMGDRPLANESFRLALTEALPDFEVVTFDLKPAIKRDKILLGSLAARAAGRYAAPLARRWHRPGVAIFRTETAARRLRQLSIEKLAGRTWVATVQIQSLFDAHTPGVPHLVYTDHTHMANLSYPDFDARRTYDWRWAMTEARTFENATKVLVRSTNVAHSLETQYGLPTSKVEVIYAGPNAPIRAGTNEGRDPNRLLFVGIDFERKGGPDLLAAFRQLRQRHPSLTLTIVGATPSPEDGVEVVGRVPADQLADHFARSGVFCMPTRVEPFGVVFAEALAAGLPIVATDVGAVPDMVEEGVNGFLVAPHDVNALADRLERVIGDPDRQIEMGMASRRLSEERYTWPQVGRRLRSVLLPLIS